MTFACYDGIDLRAIPMAVTLFQPVRLVFLVLMAWFLLVPVGSTRADCLSPGGSLPPDQISKLQANPAAIFLNAQGAPLSNAELISKVRDLVTADKAALKAIVEALKFAGAEEKSAIGTALGQAAQACLTTQAAYAADIQDALASSTDQAAILAFSAVTGNVPIGATGGGGGAGGAGGGAGGSSTGGGPSSGGGGTTTGGGGGGGGGTTPTGFVIPATAAPTTVTLVTTPTAATTTTVTNTATSVSP
jgi:hypothetical protein